MSDKNSGLSKLFDVLAKIVAIIVLLAMGFMILKGIGVFGAEAEVSEAVVKITQISTYVILYAAIVLASLTALEFSTKHGLLLTIIVLALIALVVIPTFLPGVWSSILSAVGAAA